MKDDAGEKPDLLGLEAALLGARGAALALRMMTEGDVSDDGNALSYVAHAAVDEIEEALRITHGLMDQRS